MDNSDLHPADRAAFAAALGAQPVWDRIETAAVAFGLEQNILLHAGPPFATVDAVSTPILNSACVAAVFEGLAPDFARAEAMIRSGEILLRPAQDYACVTPLAAVLSASMPLHRVVDANAGEVKIYAPVNGGSRPAMRLGLRSGEVLEHIRWLNGPFVELLQQGLNRPQELIPIAAEALRHGDDCHGRTPQGSRLMMQQLEAGLPGNAVDADTRQFIDSSPSLFLNLWMAASKCIMQCASGIADSSFVTAAGGNGVATGIQLAAMPGRWFSAAAQAPRGQFDVDLPPARGLPAIGDSAVVEALGLGAMALRHAPEQEKNLGDFLPDDYRERAAALLAGVHPGFGELDCRVGLSARAAVAAGRGPVIGLGILDLEGEQGRLGGGVYDMPVTAFAAALAALES